LRAEIDGSGGGGGGGVAYEARGYKQARLGRQKGGYGQVDGPN